MSRLFTTVAAIAAFLALAAGANAAVLGYTPHGNVYHPPDGVNVTDIAVDNANRTWYSTNKGGLMAFSGVAAVSGFPIVSDLFTPSLSSIAFGDADVSGDIQESFFIGSNLSDLAQGYVTGAQYGRVLEGSRVSFGADLCSSPTTASYEGEITCALVAAHASEPAAGVVNDFDLASSGTQLWVATDLGVTYLELPNLTVGTDEFNILDAGYAVPQATKVIAADETLSGGVAFYIAQDEVHMIFGSAPPYGERTFNALTTLPLPATVGAIALDDVGNLWVAETTTARSLQRIFRYTATSLFTWAANPDPALEPAPMASPFSFDPQDPDSASGYFDIRQINEMSVNDGTNELWVATTKGAFFQDFSTGDLNPKLCSQGFFSSDPSDDLDGNNNVCDGLNEGWHPLPQNENDFTTATNENYGAVLADASANVWLGSDAGFRSVIARLLTLSGTRFIGVGATVGITLTDITAGDPVIVNVTVGSESADITLTASGVDTYTGSFGFTYGASPPVAPSYLFPVVSTAAGIEITVTYTYNITQQLIATASWAEIVPFEDDLWIGGPCMIRAMER